MFIDLIKANVEVNRLNKELAEVKTDRDAQVTKLAEFEKVHKDYIESAQTAEQMKAAHAKEIETLKADYEGKLAAKDKELTEGKAASEKALTEVKVAAEKEVTEVKESVAAETIRIVASQSTNVVVETAVEVMTPEKALAQFNSLKGEEKQKFYEQNYNFFQGYIQKGNPTK